MKTTNKIILDRQIYCGYLMSTLLHIVSINKDLIAFPLLNCFNLVSMSFFSKSVVKFVTARFVLYQESIETLCQIFQHMRF